MIDYSDCLTLCRAGKVEALDAIGKAYDIVLANGNEEPSRSSQSESHTEKVLLSHQVLVRCYHRAVVASDA